MSKRQADYQLTHDNWEEELEKPEEGTFAKASETDISKRVVRTGKRRLAKDGAAPSKPGGIFASFGGFGTKSVPETAAKPAPSATASPDKKSRLSNGSATAFRRNEDEEFCEQLKELNLAVLSWVGQHVKNSPYLDLTPVFQDYIKHLSELESKFVVDEGTVATSEAQTRQTRSRPDSSEPIVVLDGDEDDMKAGKEQKQPAVKKIEFPALFGSTPAKSEDSKPGTGVLAKDPPSTFFGKSTETPTFAFEKKSEDAPKFSIGASQPATESAAPTFSFGKPATDEKKTEQKASGFSFGLTPTQPSASPGSGFFSFGAVSAPAQAPAARSTAEQEDEPYEPPKPENVDIEEPDAFFTIKCKLFYKKDGEFVEKGLGSLYLKPMETGKTQLLIRAGTTLGNVLLNVGISASTPCQRMGKNNLTIICVPNPPLTALKADEDPSEPACLLIRVKTADDADELLKQIQQSVQEDA